MVLWHSRPRLCRWERRLRLRADPSPFAILCALCV